MKKILLLFLVLLAIFSNIYSNDYSKEANFIFRNSVSVNRIDSFLFNPKYTNSEKEFIARSLVVHKDEKAIKLFMKMLNDSNRTLQSLSIMPLINAGELDVAFSKFKILAKGNYDEVLINFYEKNFIGDFSNIKIHLYRKYKNRFAPLLKNICNDDSISYRIKLEAANTLYYFDGKETLEKICTEILKNIPDHELITKNHNEFTEKQRSDWHLRHRASNKLKMCKE